jgi:hypothetical protein
MALSATYIKNSTKHSGKPSGDKHTDGGGMYLLVKAAGKYWRMDYRFANKRKTLSLGTYPEVSLVKARIKREKAREQLADGIDPSSAKREEKEVMRISAENTLKSIALEWHSTYESGWSKTHAQTTLDRMEKNIFPWLGNRLITEIEAPEVLMTLRRIEARGAIDTTHRIRSILNTVFRFAIGTGRATRNPAADVGIGLKTTITKHRPAITEPKRFAQLLRDIFSYSGSHYSKWVTNSGSNKD